MSKKWYLRQDYWNDNVLMESEVMILSDEELQEFTDDGIMVMTPLTNVEVLQYIEEWLEVALHSDDIHGDVEYIQSFIKRTWSE